MEDWNGKRIFELAEQGDEVCQLAIEEMTRNLAYGILNISYFLEPEVLAIGGSISQNPVFIQAIQEQLEAIQRNIQKNSHIYQLFVPATTSRMPISWVLI